MATLRGDISFRYLKKILFKKQLFDLEVKGQGPMKVITVCNKLP
jgi:hypothetical protein